MKEKEQFDLGRGYEEIPLSGELLNSIAFIAREEAEMVGAKTGILFLAGTASLKHPTNTTIEESKTVLDPNWCGCCVLESVHFISGYN
ncbi:MAG: hypothetical protein O9302_06975 [Cyclobacteriaceae bacterium]|jgi:hypothetical protein|nr:hypothetical protein [Cytophagales bacterium]MCZ8327783.1 hypothetical protein [Cyclobacteriaceae bacterium]